VESLDSSSRLLSFSTLQLSQVKQDDVRYPINYWIINEK
jgi:hypothetical protein